MTVLSQSTIDIGRLLTEERAYTTTPALLDVDRLVQSRMLIQANSGGGKSHAIRLLAERTGGMLPFTLFDREGEFHTLREMHDLLIVGGDVPISPASAGVTARATMESGVSVIVNLSELHVAQRQAYVRDWLQEMLLYGRAHPSPRLVIIDEAHDFAPEGGGDSESFDAVRDLMATGRKRRLCGILATQRLSKLSKDAAAEANNVLIGRCTLDTDQARAAAALGFGKRDGTRLRDLKAGMFYAFGPAFGHDGVEPLKTDDVTTTHGEDALQLKAPAPSEGIAAAIAVLAKAAEAEALARASKDQPGDSDPSEDDTERIADLRAEIHTLREQCQSMLEERDAANARCAEHDHDHKLAVEVVKGELSGMVTILDQCIGRLRRAWEAITDPWDAPAKSPLTPSPPPASVPGGKSYAEPPVPAENGSLDSVRAGSSGPHTRAGGPVSPGGGLGNQPPASGAANEAVPVGAAGRGKLPADLGAPHQKILDALAWWRAAGIEKPTRPQLAAVAGYAATGGTFARYLSALSSACLVIYPASGEVSLSQRGASLARAPKHASLADLHDAALAVLETPHRKILTVLLRSKGAEMSRTQVAELAGYEVSGGTFNRYVSTLSSAGMIRYPKRTTIAAATWLFPKSLGGAR